MRNRTRPPTHPGEVLRKEYLEEYDITPRELADHIVCPLFLIKGVLEGHQRLTVDLAARLAAAFGTSTDFWLNLQAECDRHEARGRSTPVDKLPQVEDRKEEEEFDFDFPSRPGDNGRTPTEKELEDILEKLRRDMQPDVWPPEDPNDNSDVFPWDTTPKYEPYWPNKRTETDDDNDTWDSYIVTCDTDMVIDAPAETQDAILKAFERAKQRHSG